MQFSGAFARQSTLLTQGVKAALPNIEKQTQRGCQIQEAKKYGPSERTEKTPEKELNETEIVNPSDAKFKTLVIRVSENSLNMAKKIVK